MAGRGTDIKLGAGVTESEAVVQVKDPDGKDIDVDGGLGGLHIIGSERHESRRIDRQLRGRAGRQGDPGASQFFLSLEDDLMRLFGSERIAELMDRMGAQEGEVLDASAASRGPSSSAQKRVELQNFQARKRLLEYDDVMNQQREVIYSLRRVRARRRRGAQGRSGQDDRRGDHAARRARRWPSSSDPSSGISTTLQQDLLMHYMLQVPELRPPRHRPAADARRPQRTGREAAGREAFGAKLDEPGQRCATRRGRATATGCWRSSCSTCWTRSGRTTSTISTSCATRFTIARGARRIRSSSTSRKPTTMFVDLMNDIANTFTERFLKVQLVFEQAPVRAVVPAADAARAVVRSRPTKRYNAMGILEDVADDGGVETAVAQPEPVDVQESVTPRAVARGTPSVVGAGSVRSLAPGGGALPVGWENTPRNNACPCGSGKKFKKCHGANL